MANFLFIGLFWIITITLGSTFEPRLQWICQPSTIVLTIKTDEPFEGVAHAVGYRSTCSSFENGTTLTNMIIPLGGQDNECGVTFNNVTGTFWVEVEIHPHHTLVSEYDRIFNVTCDITSISQQSAIDFFLELYPLPSSDVDENRTPKNLQANNTELGRTYILDGFMASFDDEIKYSNQFRMHNCILESNDSTAAIEIIDSNGCSTNSKHITEIVYRDGWVNANLSDVNPYLKMLKLKCEFSICDETENCRPTCNRQWYDSAIKGGKNFAKWLTSIFDDSSKPAAAIPQSSTNKSLQSASLSTIVHLLVPLQTDIIPPQSHNFFIKKCPIIDFYFYSFKQCCMTEEIFWLYVAVAVVWILLVISIVCNIYYCFQKIKAVKNKFTDSEEEGDYWCYENFKIAKGEDDEDDDPHKKVSLFRRLSKRRRPSADEIYATIKSRASTHRLRITPVSQHIYENPYVTMPNTEPPVVEKYLPRANTCSIEENPYYVCQIPRKHQECGSFF